MEHVKEKLARFTTDQLKAMDEKGYNALLKACSLPSMSPHVMQYLVTTKKVDINCQLPRDFDRSTAKGLIPEMSALSVAINSGNVKLVSIFMKRRKEISIPSSDAEGNTALHHCVLSGSKESFRKIFPLFKPLKWKKMRNSEGKNPLEIVRELKQLREGKKKEKEKFTYMEMTMRRKDSKRSMGKKKIV
ncbi:hypothetical protein OS493_004645 [Desmophyllum pertusum]|uniref:Uncharacterized protein n=1 Tax=Desmophyllum pertusum TaxID=174260 RepID=A0A9W9ZHG1_9CNID|nr:hypothetical protein OS493_004645 [Desmophyllum pertusum]